MPKQLKLVGADVLEAHLFAFLRQLIENGQYSRAHQFVVDQLYSGYIRRTIPFYVVSMHLARIDASPEQVFAFPQNVTPK